MDPISAISIASTAYSAIVKGFQVGRDVESMAGDLGRWMGAIQDVKNSHEKARGRKFGSIEEEALETFAAKKKAERMEEELRNFIKMNYGHNAWDQVIRIQGEIRKARQEEQERRKKEFEELITIIAIILGLLIFAVIITVLIWKFKYAA
jgi:hypothetical protein